MKEAQTRKHLLAIIVCVITALLCTVPASSALGKDDILTVGVPINRCPISYQEASYNRNQWEKGKLSADIASRLPLAIQSEEIQVW